MLNEFMPEHLPNVNGLHDAHISALTYQRPTVTYYSFDTIEENEMPEPGDLPATTVYFLSLQRESSIPAHELHLEYGCILTIRRNLDINKGLVKNRQVLVE